MRRALISLALAIAFAAPAAAQRFDAPMTRVSARSDSTIARVQVVPMSQARRAVRQRFPGSEILDSWVRKNRNGDPVEYVVRIVTRDGRRLDVRVDAHTGRVIG